MKNMPPKSQITALKTEAEWLNAFPIAQALWPELERPTYLQTLASMVKTGYILFGLHVKGELVAIAGCQEIQLLARGKILWLFDMATHPNKQGAGFGSQLLAFLQQYAKSNGYSRLLLHTSAGRTATLAFYRSRLGEPFGVVFRAVTGNPNA